ncbi:hypothetical protein ACET3Z_010603 [Daucus carota]
MLYKKGARRTSRLMNFRPFKPKKWPKIFNKQFHAKVDAQPIMNFQETSFDVMKRLKRLMKDSIMEVRIDYDKDKNAEVYKLFHHALKSVVKHTTVDKEFKIHRSKDTRSIYFFELERMIEILKDDDTVPPKEEKTGVAPDDEVVDLTGDDDEEQAQQPHDIESTRQAWK